MAFYFGKENFKAATDSVSQIARQLTSQEKLGQTNVQKIGKPMEAIAPLRFDETDKLESVTLDKLEEKMRAKAPPFERLPILSAKGAPSMVVHRSVLNDFLLSKKTADPEKDAKDYNLSDLVKDYPWLQQDASLLCLQLPQLHKRKMQWHREKAAPTYLLQWTALLPLR